MSSPWHDGTSQLIRRAKAGEARLWPPTGLTARECPQVEASELPDLQPSARKAMRLNRLVTARLIRIVLGGQITALRPLCDTESPSCRGPRADHGHGALVALNVTSSSRQVPGGAR